MKFWIGPHRIILSREPMIGMGFDVDAWPCIDHHGKKMHLWRARVWFGPWLLSVQFNESNP